MLMLKYRHKNKSLRVKKGNKMKIKGLFLALMAILLFGGSSAFAKSSSLEKIYSDILASYKNMDFYNPELGYTKPEKIFVGEENIDVKKIQFKDFSDSDKNKVILSKRLIFRKYVPDERLNKDDNAATNGEFNWRSDGIQVYHRISSLFYDSHDIFPDDNIVNVEAPTFNDDSYGIDINNHIVRPRMVITDTKGAKLYLELQIELLPESQRPKENTVNNNNATSSNVRVINNISDNDKQGNTIDNKNSNNPSSMILSPNTGLYPANTNIIIISFLGIASLVGLFIKRQIAKIKI